MLYLVPNIDFDYYFKLNTTATGKELDYEILKLHFYMHKINMGARMISSKEIQNIKETPLTKLDIINILNRLGYGK